MVDGRHDHAHLEADDENGRHQLVLRAAVVAQVHVVGPAEGEEQEPAKDVAPDVDRLVRPPEYALDAEPRGQNVPVAGRDERVELQILGRLLKVQQLPELCLVNRRLLLLLLWRDAIGEGCGFGCVCAAADYQARLDLGEILEGGRVEKERRGD